MVSRRHSRVVRVALLVAVILAGGATPSARAAVARVRWKPASSPVAGYRIYVRSAGTPYGAPIDVGLPMPAADGTLTALVSVDVAPAYHVAVASYAADGLQSPLSGELAVGTLDPCVVDRCAAVGSCQFRLQRNGTWCMHAGEADPCLSLGACVAGRCTANTAGAGQLASTRVRLAVRRRAGTVAVHGVFSADPTLDPRATGATLELADETGALFYYARIPGAGFTMFDQGNGFRYVTSRSAARAVNGFRVLNLRRSDRNFRVTARAESGDLRAGLARPALHATLRFGDTCARDLGLACRALVGGGLSCR